MTRRTFFGAFCLAIAALCGWKPKPKSPPPLPHGWVREESAVIDTTATLRDCYDPEPTSICIWFGNVDNGRWEIVSDGFAG